MGFRWIEVICPADRAGEIADAAREAEVSEILRSDAGDDRCSLRLLAGEIDRQGLIDRIQEILDGTEGWRLVVTVTEAVAPRKEEEDERQEDMVEGSDADRNTSSREEVFSEVVAGASLNRDYLILVGLATLVAAIGLSRGDTAVVIGAMVIAPLLGPNLALAFASAVGDRALLLRALRSLGAGLALPVALSLVVPLVVEVDPGAAAIAGRTAVDFGSMALALASGTAAALSITSRVSALLVGVMVSAALLPAAVALGMMLAALQFPEALGAGLLLGANVAAILLAATLTFLAKGIRPRTWLERQDATQSLRVTIPVLVAALLAIGAFIVLDPAFRGG